MEKEAIITCPTRLRAIKEWERFSGSFAPAIKTINKAKLSITMKNGQKLIFMSDQEKNRMFGRDPLYTLTFSIEDFEVMLKKALEERLNAKNRRRNNPDNMKALEIVEKTKEAADDREQ